MIRQTTIAMLGPDAATGDMLDRVEAEIASLEAEMERLRQRRHGLDRRHREICRGAHGGSFHSGYFGN